MPDGLKRNQQAHDLHSITFSCYHRRPFLASPQAKEAVEDLLERTRARHGARIYG
jgi:putative transposase